MATTAFDKQILKVVVGQICQTIGWNGINSSPLETLIDVLHRYLLEIARTTHHYTDQFGRTAHNLDDLGLAFADMGINVSELQEYVDFVDSVPCNIAVPKYPVHKDSHLNFLKPGSQEVMTRPVHVNEHLPPTLELSVEVSADMVNSPQPSPTFKRPGDPIETGATKRARLGFEEEGRPLREISSVMMTTGGFISSAREGKLPEPRVAFPASDLRAASPPPHHTTVTSEPHRESKKKITEVAKEKVKDRDKDRERKKEKRQHLSHDQQPKKLPAMKELKKLKALKSHSSKHINPHREKTPTLPPAPEKSLLQKLSESPHLVVTPVPMDVPPPVVKLAAEPDREKLNIFKKISKVKDEEVVPIIKDEPIYSSPGSPSTPKTPDILKSPEHKKKKKDKDRERKKRHKDSDKSKHHAAEADRDRRPKTPDVPISLPSPFPFFPQGLVPPVISNPLIPRFPMPLGPNFPNLPLPPAFLQQPKPDVTIEPIATSSKSPLALLLNEKLEKDIKKGKEHKKEKKEKKKKKDKDKDRERTPKDKPKKDKKEKKHSDDKHKEHKSKEKKEKKEKRKEKERSREKEREKEKLPEKEKEKEESSVPKLMLKIGTPTGSRPASPKRATEDDPKRPVVKPEEPPKKDKDKVPEPSDIARISSLFSKPPKEQKPLHVQTDSLKIPSEGSSANVQKSPGTIIDKDGNKVWICPSCGRPDDGTPMIGCDECDAWYHWVCVGIQVPPDENENWYCRFCIVKKQGSHSKKKRGRKKKPPV